MKELLRFLTCGSVDDGKSTLIGRLLYDAKLLFADQAETLERESRAKGAIDYSLLLDGLTAEREQGITIDVAYRYFTTKRRSFIVADAPGHEEYTRNMAVGASNADLAVILVDASRGVLIQTRRHTRICAMTGIRDFVFAVNKMDLAGYGEDAFRAIETQIRALTAEFPVKSLAVIPTCATGGDNVTEKSVHMPWYEGKPLLAYLEEIDVARDADGGAFVLPVQRVCRPNADFRGYQGQICSGSVAVGDEVTVFPSREKSTVSSILRLDSPVDSAAKGDPVTVRLASEVDVSRGCVLARDADLTCDRLITADLLWLDDEPLKPGKSYLLELATQKTPVVITSVRYKTNVNTGEREHSGEVAKNELASCEMYADRDAVYDLFDRNRTMGRLILIDRVSHATSACGVIRERSRADDLFWRRTDVDRAKRENRLGQKAQTIWFTGVSGAGKSTLANALERRLFLEGRATMILDADNVRQGLNRDLGFTARERTENIRRIAETARLMNDAGLIVLVSVISPLRTDRRMARSIIGDAFREVWVSTPVEVCASRDVKGLYKRAIEEKLPNFTGVSAPYETPEHAEIEIDTTDRDVEDCVEELLRVLRPGE